jgi:hypothetical protein
MKYNKSILVSAAAFIVATSCCWLPALVILLGGGSTLISISNGVEKMSGLFMALGIGLLALGTYQIIRKKKKSDNIEVILKSIVTCPECGHRKQEIMPTNACQYFYECVKCKAILKPKEGDCCVYCSYGSMDCPPIQQGVDCC